jgi:hypothetical protein
VRHGDKGTAFDKVGILENLRWRIHGRPRQADLLGFAHDLLPRMTLQPIVKDLHEGRPVRRVQAPLLRPKARVVVEFRHLHHRHQTRPPVHGAADVNIPIPTAKDSGR